MKRKHFDKNSDEWLEWRKGKITGSRLKDIVVKRGTKMKLGFYEIIAERLAVPHELDNETAIERGHILEPEAIDNFTSITGLEVNTDCGVWISDDNDFIAISPDGEIDENQAVEVKCLSSAKHLEAFFTQKVPSEYEEQMMQYFLVNEKLQILYFVFYDPRIPAKSLHYLTINREDIEEDIQYLKDYQTQILKDIDEKINQLTF